MDVDVGNSATYEPVPAPSFVVSERDRRADAVWRAVDTLRLAPGTTAHMQPNELAITVVKLAKRFNRYLEEGK
jgi:hypothetical protein